MLPRNCNDPASHRTQFSQVCVLILTLSLSRHRQVLPAGGIAGTQVFLPHHPLG